MTARASADLFSLGDKGRREMCAVSFFSELSDTSSRLMFGPSEVGPGGLRVTNQLDMRGRQVGSREFSVRGVAAGFLERLRNLWSACEIIWDGCKPFGAAANHLVRLQIVWGGCKSFGAAADYLGRLQIIWDGCKPL